MILENINLSLKENEKFFLIGSSGAGKTSLFNSIIDSKIIKKGNLTYRNNNVLGLKKKKKRNAKVNWIHHSKRLFFRVRNSLL
ncbi:ATP-binding cassette domain-containing protein [Candidatus Mycoplasma mahonii]|uniref:ATP-binding cassette domain-containing protein n=1 Tax=Candidatus Mycoplasma mahonii TaxID=3004105 RepID=UPI003570BD75